VHEEDRPWRPSNVGLLLLADQPDAHLPGAYVDIAVYDHDIADGNTLDTKRITGPIPDQIEGVLRYLRTSLELSGRRPELTNLGHAVRLTVFAARGEDPAAGVERG